MTAGTDQYFPSAGDSAAHVPNVSAREFLGQGAIRMGTTGAVRDARQGKGRFDLLFLGFAIALRRLAEHCEAGAIKYSDRNWEYGQPLSWFLDSGTRHAASWAAGMGDEDHLKAAAWNFMAALETRERIKEGLLPEALDDLALPLAADAQARHGDAMPLPKWAGPYVGDT